MDLPIRGVESVLTGRTGHRNVRRSTTLVVRAAQGGLNGKPGERIERWLQTPFDIAAFGPRATLGALLSTPEKLQNLQSDLQRVSDLLQDPRPVDQKKDLFLEEIETQLSEFLEKGATIEADILANVKTVLPEEIASAIPEPPLPAPPPPPPPAQPTEVEPEIVYTAESVAVDQDSAAVSGLRDALGTVQNTLSALKSNTTTSRENMLKLNLREARDRLETLLQEVSSDSSAVGDVVSDARALLVEVDAEL